LILPMFGEPGFNPFDRLWSGVDVVFKLGHVDRDFPDDFSLTTIVSTFHYFISPS
jgi:hypothetical protein